MTTNELKSYIDRILGNNIRLLLPSYWWKRAFGAVIDKVDEKVEKSDLKTINGKSLFGAGNIVIEGGGGGAGLQYATERTVYQTEYRLGDYSESIEISEEERAYNAETFEMVRNDEPVFLSFSGIIMPYVECTFLASTGEGHVRFNVVLDNREGDFIGGIVSVSVKVYSNGDAVQEMSPIETGSAPSTPRDMNSDFNNDF